MKPVLLLGTLAVGVQTVGLAQTAPAPAILAVNLSNQTVQNVPMTFGQPFRAGDIPNGQTVAAYLGDQALPTQVDAKAANADGSLRHAVLTVQLPILAANASEKLSLRTVSTSTALGRSVALTDVLATHFDASVNLTISGQPWHLDARTLLQDAVLTRSCAPNGRTCNQWLSGPLASAWVVGGPVLSPAGIPNPHIAVYFAVRAYGPAPVTRVRVDVVVENDWAYAPDPQGIAYDATINVGGATVYSINNLTHYRQARWHKVFWWGGANPVYAQQDSAYLQYSLAVPRYEDVPAPASLLKTVVQTCAPMRHCDQSKDMSTVGAQPAIGPLPLWTSAYVINPTYRAFRWMLANNDALGSYPTHYRDHATGQPVSVEAHPCVTLITGAEAARCKFAPYGDDRLPKCRGTAECKVPWVANIAHVPSGAYVAYLVTGDWYYLSEMKDWANWELVDQNPMYRGYTTGYINRLPLRAQAWALRTLGYAAYILPDNDPSKAYFNQVVKDNIAWYNQQYTDNHGANQLRIITNSSIVYPNNGQANTGIATWQQSFFNWSVGNLNDLGFAGADRLLAWLAPFQIGLMTDPGYCWIEASAYELQVRDTRASPFYTTLQQVYQKNFSKLRKIPCANATMAAALSSPGGYTYKAGEMMGYPSSPTGFPANFQIGLAASADTGVPYAKQAWELFALRTTQPDYSKQPQWAVIPRSLPAGRNSTADSATKPSGGTSDSSNAGENPNPSDNANCNPCGHVCCTSVGN